MTRPTLSQIIGGAIGAAPHGYRQDAPGTNQPGTSRKAPDGPLITQPQKIAIRSLVLKLGLAHYQLTDILYQQFGTYSLERLSKAQAHDLHMALQQALQEKKDQEKQNGIPHSGTPSGDGSRSRNGRTAVAIS